MEGKTLLQALMPPYKHISFYSDNSIPSDQSFQAFRLTPLQNAELNMSLHMLTISKIDREILLSTQEREIRAL